jgi:predicted AAA+ superfamily ATPase
MPVIPRFLRPASGHFFLFGPRGTGKSTWPRQRYRGALWIDLLAPDVHREYAARPERLRELVDGNPDKRVVIVDEVQKAPALLDVAHQLAERPRCPRFVLTGSSARKLRRGGVDLLAGRAVVRALHPFMAAELGRRFDLDRALQQGLIPLVWSAKRPTQTLRAYVALYLREEVQMEGVVRRIEPFARFLEAISFSHAGVLNLSEVARECAVGRSTVEAYLQVLEDLLLGFRLGVFTRRAKRHLVAHPKFYWFDAGAFVSMRPAGPLDRPEEIAGAALEGLVAQHLRAWIDYSGSELSLAYWRTKSGNEVDFVLYGSTGFWAVEVMSTPRVRPRDLVGLRSFREDYPNAKLVLLYRGRDSLAMDGIRCVPVEEFLRQLVPGRPLLPEFPATPSKA